MLLIACTYGTSHIQDSWLSVDGLWFLLKCIWVHWGCDSFCTGKFKFLYHSLNVILLIDRHGSSSSIASYFEPKEPLQFTTIWYWEVFLNFTFKLWNIWCMLWCHSHIIGHDYYYGILLFAVPEEDWVVDCQMFESEFFGEHCSECFLPFSAHQFQSVWHLFEFTDHVLFTWWYA